VCALPGLRTLVVLAYEVRRDGQVLEILDIKRLLLAGGGQELVGVGPRLAPEGLTRPLDHVGHTHSVAHLRVGTH
jgi:hypothetical protein